jgi:hypothetical protein
MCSPVNTASCARRRSKNAAANITPSQVVDNLDAKIAALLRRIEQSEVYQIVSNPKSDPGLVTAIVKNILLEVFSYGPHVTEATFTAISRMPKKHPELMKPMILHDLEEVDHGEMALVDYVKLGGCEAFARSRRMTPASFAMGAACRMLAEREDPFAYLGYMYLFEAMTPILTERVQGFLKAIGFPAEAQKFIDFHAEEDIAHANVLRTLIERSLMRFPESASAVEYGFDCFEAVYPLPIWAAALERTRQELAASEQPKELVSLAVA